MLILYYMYTLLHLYFFKKLKTICQTNLLLLRNITDNNKMSIDIPTAIAPTAFAPTAFAPTTFAKEIRAKLNACMNTVDDSKAHLCFELFELLLTWPGRKLMLNDFKAYEYIARKVDSILEDDELDDYEDLQDLADDLYIVMNNIKLSFKE